MCQSATRGLCPCEGFSPLARFPSAQLCRPQNPSQGAETLRRGEAHCGDGQVRDFVGTTRLEFRGVVTCRLESSGARTALSVRGASAWTCAVEGGTVSCQER